MSGFSKVLAGEHANAPSYMGYDFTVRITEQWERCLTPVSSPTLEYCEYLHNEHDEQQGSAAQPAPPALKPNTESGSHAKETVTKCEKMTGDEIIARIDWDREKERAERVAHLLKRREEIYRFMAAEREMHKRWREQVMAKFEECEEIKRALLRNMKREERMKLVKREFILLLLSVDFDHEVEDVYGAGKHIFRSFDEF